MRPATQCIIHISEQETRFQRKTNYVIFQSKQKKSIEDLFLLIDDKLIIRKQQIKLLGPWYAAG
jgi:hypothetical protein